MHNGVVPAGGVESSSGIDRLAEVHGLFLRSSILLFSMCLIPGERGQRSKFAMGALLGSDQGTLHALSPPLL